MLKEFREQVLATANIGDRMYPDTLPQQPTLPAISYQVISETRRATMRGPDDLSRVRVQVDCWANTSIEAHAVADSVRAALDGFKGPMGSASPIEAAAVGIFAVNAFSSYEPEARIYRVSRDFFVWARD